MSLRGPRRKLEDEAIHLIKIYGLPRSLRSLAMTDAIRGIRENEA